MQKIPLAWKNPFGSEIRGDPCHFWRKPTETLFFRKGFPPPHARGRQKRSHLRSQEIPAPFPGRGGEDATPPLQARKGGPTSQESQFIPAPLPRCPFPKTGPGGGKQASSRPDRGPPRKSQARLEGGQGSSGVRAAPPRALSGRKKGPPRPPRGSFGPRGPRRGRRAREETMKRRFLEGEAASPGQEGPALLAGGGGRGEGPAGASRASGGWRGPSEGPRSEDASRQGRGEKKKNAFPPFRGLCRLWPRPARLGALGESPASPRPTRPRRRRSGPELAASSRPFPPRQAGREKGPRRPRPSRPPRRIPASSSAAAPSPVPGIAS